MNRWRFVPLLQTTAAIQMAIDAWLLDEYEQGQQPPTLRFYTWWPPALSLGHLQKRWPDHWHHLTYQGQPLDLVRRPTGGRAVLHQGDLSYALVMTPPVGKRSQVYTDLCRFLIQGWQTLGTELYYGAAQRGYMHNPSCFNTTTAADLVTATGDKLIGSAQRWGKNALLQHGSMVLSTDRALFQEVFGQVAPWERSLGPPSQGSPPVVAIVDTLATAAQQCLGIELVNQPFSQTEWEQILQQARSLDPAGIEHSVR